MGDESLKVAIEKHAASFSPENIKVGEILGGKGWLLRNVMNKEECKDLIAESEKRGYDFKASGNRFCHRSVVNDVPFASWLWERIRPHVPTEYIDEKMRKWVVCGINPSLRNCKYSPGNYFGPRINEVEQKRNKFV